MFCSREWLHEEELEQHRDPWDTKEKVCQFKLVLLGKKTSERARVYLCYVCEVVTCAFLSSGCMYVHYSSYQKEAQV